MKKNSHTICLPFLLLLIVFLPISIQAQLTGTYNIPGTPFVTITQAVDSLNIAGVGTGGVTFNVAAGYTENITAPILLTTTGTAANPIIFQKSGAGVNPLVTRTDAGSISTSVLGGQGDAVIIIEGSDYITFNAINLTASEQGIEYGYYLRKLNGDDGCKFVTITNSVVTMTKGTSAYVVGIYSSNNDAASLPSSATGITVTSVGGRNENVTITGNTIQNVHAAIVLRGFNHTTAPYDFYDQNFAVGSVGAGNIIQNFGGGSATSSYGIYMIYHNNLSIGYNSLNNTSGGGTPFGAATSYGIFTSTATSSSISIINNTVTLTGGGTTTLMHGINNAAGSTAASNTVTVSNNTVTGCSYPSATSAAFTGIVNSASAATVNMINNTVSNNSLEGTGTLTGIDGGGSTATALTMYDNAITGNTKTGASGSIFNLRGSGGTVNVYDNQIYNNGFTNSSGTASCIMYGYYNFGSPPVENVYSNNIYNLYISGTNTGTSSLLNGIHTNTTATAVKQIYGNNIYSLTALSGSVNGIAQFLGTDAKIYKNNIYNLTNNTNVTTSARTNGIAISSGTVYTYNNFLSELKAPLAEGDDAVRGISVTSTTATTTIGIYYNTVYLNATSAGTNFGTTGIFHTYSATASTAALDMRNNVVVNNSTPIGTGRTVAFRRSASTDLNNYSTLSNNNDFYAGTPGTNNLIFFDGTNADQTIGNFKSRVTPRETATFTENPPFINVTTPPYNLRMITTVPTQVESGGAPVNTPIVITDDYDGTTRSVTSPDVGANEFNGLPQDLTPPAITYTPLLNTSSTSARTLSTNISDFSGVPTAGIGLPVLYWRINSGIWNAATATYLSGSNYQFSFGSGVVLGDTVKYYIVAQDNAVPPNVGAFPSGGAGGFTPNPPFAATPPTTPSAYLITNLALAGDYTVGLLAFNTMTGKNIYFEKSVSKVLREVFVEELQKDKFSNQDEMTSNSIQPDGIKQLVEVEEISWIPMENGRVYEGDLFIKKVDNPLLDFPASTDGIYATITAAVADLNLRGVSGPVNFLLTDDTYPTETFPITVNVTNEAKPTASSVVTFKPNTGVTSSVTGASAASQLMRILNSYITIDGSNSGGTTRNLTFENTSATTPQVIVVGSIGTTPITNVTVKNCIIINGVNTSTPLIVSDGTTPGNPGRFNNITIQNNSIQKAYIGMYNNAVVSAGNGSGLNILFNDLTTSGANSVRFTGIYVQGVDGATITDNQISNFDGVTSEDDRGIWLATGTVNTVIERNLIHTLKYTGTGGYGAHGVTVSSGTSNANNAIINNVVFDISGDGWGTSILGDNPHGIYLFSTQTGIKVYYNSIYLYGNTLNRAAAISTGITLGTGTTADLKDNVIVNNLGALTTLGLASIGIYAQSASTQLEASNYNDIWINPSGTISKFIGQIAATGYTTLLDWQTASSQDANSISADPQFQGLTDLRPAFGSPVLAAGTPIAGITTDFLGVTRSATNPSMGAYEQGVVTPLAGDYTVGLSMFNQFSGLNITFEQRVRTIEITETIVNPEAEEQIGIYEETAEGTVTIQEPADETALTPVTVTRTIEQEYFVPMLNGSEYSGELYYELTPEQKRYNPLSGRGVYATITAAKNDAILKGVSAAVRFLLVDTTYTSETFPIVINEIPGASAVNTVTLLPNTGVTALISGTPTNTQIFDFNGVDYFIIDGRAGGVGTNINLTIENLATTGTASHTIRLINGATNNIFRYVRMNNNTQGTAGPRAVDFNTSVTDPAGNSFNLIENCFISGGRTGIGFAGTVANPNSNNVIVRNKLTDFSFAGVWLSSNAANTTIDENEFFHTAPVVTSGTGISLSTSGIINIRGNKFYDLQNSTTSTLRGITGSPSAGGTVNIINNFFSFTPDNGTKTSIYAIQISGTTEHTANIYYNTFNFAGVHTGGTAGVLVSAGLVKSNTGATSVFNAKNNIGKNTRTGGTTGVIHTNFFVGTTAIVGTLDINYNAWYAFGDPGSFHAGWGAAVYNDLTAYKTAATPHEQQTIFKNVDFASGVDLHLAGLSVGDADLAGLPIAGITTDIDGDLRNVTYPYRGADEAPVQFLPILAPSMLVAIPDTFTVDLGWMDNSNNEAGFIIQRKDGDSTSVNPFVTIDTVGVNVINYLDSGLNANTTYTWRVFAINALGTSGFSNMAEATTFIPVELTAFTAELSSREILVSWITATELNNRGFDIERKMDSEWEKIGFKDGRGTTTTESYYSFVDKFTYESFVGTITYRLKQMDFDGTYAYSPEVEVDVDFTPKEYTLYQNYPNPFNPATTIKYSLPFESNVRIAVYNILGEMIDVLVDETKQVGFHNFNWNASNLASGIYIYTIEAKSVAGDKNYSSVKKMILMK
jgi:hypothetical protein